MVGWLVGVVIALALVSTGWGILTAALNKPPGYAQLSAATVLELATVAQSAVAFVRIGQGAHPTEFATTIGYLIGILVLMPAAGFWALGERTRFSGLVLAVAAFAVLAMTLRLLVLWGTVAR